MKLSFLILWSLVLVSGPVESAQEPKGQIPSERKNPATIEKNASQSQRQAGTPTAFEKSLIETLRTISDQQRSADEQNRANQKSWWIDPGLLVGIGALYTFFAACQWLAIRRQVNLERPWIMIEADWPTEGSTQQRIKWSATNAGRSPAFITRLSVKAEPLPHRLPDKRPSYPDADPFAEFILAPNGGRHSSEYFFVIDAGRKAEYYSGSMCIAFYGRIDYHDSSKKLHVTRFCVYWFQQNNRPLFSPIGPPDWVEYT